MAEEEKEPEVTTIEAVRIPDPPAIEEVAPLEPVKFDVHDVLRIVQTERDSTHAMIAEKVAAVHSASLKGASDILDEIRKLKDELKDFISSEIRNVK